MFVDASALFVILAMEDEAEDFSRRLRDASRRMTSPLAIWETVVSLRRLSGLDLETAEQEVLTLIEIAAIEVAAVEPETTPLALDAFRRYGKGRHPAALNFGDCFAYACAKHHKVPLLYKGTDFALTDIESA